MQRWLASLGTVRRVLVVGAMGICFERGLPAATTNSQPQVFTLFPLGTNGVALAEMPGRVIASAAHWAIESRKPNGTFGSSVAPGDFSGSGRRQLAIGMSNFRTSAARPVGRVWLLSFPSVGDVPRMEDSWIGQADWFRFGGELAGGDVNGDGISDLLVGMPEFFIMERPARHGIARLFLGADHGLARTSIWEQLGEPRTSNGRQVLLADVNRDGLADALVAAARVAGETNNSGRVWLFYGTRSGLATVPAWSARGTATGELFGAALAVGDINGDGWPDLLVGAPGNPRGENRTGRIKVFAGSSKGISAEPTQILAGATEGSAFGKAIAVLGDLNGDGCADIVVGAPGLSSRSNWPGEASLHFGSPTGLVGVAAWKTRGWRNGVLFGECVAKAGDVNGDGIPDLLIGAPTAPQSGVLPSRVSLWLGRRDGLAVQPDWELIAFGGPNDLGGVAGSAGDLDGDGLEDFYVTSRLHVPDEGVPRAGRIDVFRGLRRGYAAGEHFPADGKACVPGDNSWFARNRLRQETLLQQASVAHEAKMAAVESAKTATNAQKAAMDATGMAEATKARLATEQRLARRRLRIGAGATAALAAASAWLWATRRGTARRASRRERERIARDLHDDMGARAQRIQLLIERLTRAPADSAEANSLSKELLFASQELSGSVDRLVWAVKPENDTLENLVSFLAAFAPALCRPAGIECELDLPAVLPPKSLQGETRQQFMLAVNEALNNVVKHSSAGHAWLRVQWSEPWLEIVVEDDGCGLPEREERQRGADGTRTSAARLGGGNGLRNLQARMESLGGSAEITARNDGGTRVVLRARLRALAVATPCR